VIATDSIEALAKFRERRWTYEELRNELPESNTPVELWDGELVMSPSPSFNHQRIVFEFQRALDDWARDNEAGTTIGAPIDMVLSSGRVVQPDVAFVATERLDIIDEIINGPADLIAEVISPGSRNRDRIEKRDLYQRHGVKEYWLINPEAKTVEVLKLEENEYRLHGCWSQAERAESNLLDGFWVQVARLFGTAQ